MRVRAWAGILACGFGVAACFSERSLGASSGGLTCDRAELPAGPDTAIVIIRGFAFTPADTRVSAGVRIVWINCEPAGTPAHTTTVDAGAWDSPTLMPGETFSVVAPPGSYAYHCRPHPFMQGTVVVQ